ncbi:MAG: DivIVA domain-containing protein [Clostridia bacterium]|nr:DivIVA domain-containing protein [Clostridia bacterium]
MPVDFKNKLFRKSIWGYDPEEVDGYIAYVAGEYTKLEKRFSVLRSRMEEQKAQNMINAADKAPITEAKAEAGTILAQAREEAEKLLAEAEEQKTGVLAEAEKAKADAQAEAGTILAEARDEAEMLLAEAEEQRAGVLAEIEKAKADAEAEAGAILEGARERAEEIRSAIGADEGPDAFVRPSDGEAPAAGSGWIAANAARFKEDVAAFSHAMESLTRTQMNAVRRFSEDADRFFAQSAPAPADDLAEDVGDPFGFAAAASMIGDLLREEREPSDAEEGTPAEAADPGTEETAPEEPAEHGGTDAMIAGAALADRAAEEADRLREELRKLSDETRSDEGTEEAEGQSSGEDGSPSEEAGPGTEAGRAEEEAGDEELEAVMAALSGISEDESYDAILSSFRPEDLAEEAEHQAEGIRKYLAEKEKAARAAKEAAEKSEDAAPADGMTDLESEITAAVEAAVRAKLDPGKAVDAMLENRNQPLPRDLLDMLDFEEPQDGAAAYTDHSLTEFTQQKRDDNAEEEAAPEDGDEE